MRSWVAGAKDVDYEIGPRMPTRAVSFAEHIKPTTSVGGLPQPIITDA